MCIKHQQTIGRRGKCLYKVHVYRATTIERTLMTDAAEAHSAGRDTSNEILPAIDSSLPARTGSPPATLNHSSSDQSSIASAAKEEVLLTKEDQPLFSRLPGETPRAFSAFITWFQFGHARSH